MHFASQTARLRSVGYDVIGRVPECSGTKILPALQQGQADFFSFFFFFMRISNGFSCNGNAVYFLQPYLINIQINVCFNYFTNNGVAENIVE